jgi:hypothetical protein
MADIRVDVQGADKLADALRQVPRRAQRYLQAAGKEAAAEILDTEGLRRYPPADAANQPPPPYYIRGRGMQYKARNDGRSERYGTRYYVKSEGYSTIIGNSASYAMYLTDAKLQARHMAARGWRKLAEVAQSKIGRIRTIYQGWVEKLLRDVGL